MTSLTKLHRSANSTASEEEFTRNVKRKFMNGISADLRRNVFIFCNKPHEPTVSVDNLLEAVRRAKLHTTEQTDGAQTVNVVESNTSSNDALLNAIEGIRDTLNIHIQSTDGQFRDVSKI